MSDCRPIPLLPASTAEPAELVASILKRREGGGLLKLDRMLLHSAPLCEGWNFFFGKVRGGLSLPPRMKELIMCTVAVLTGAHYQYEHHAPLYIAEGASADQAAAIRDIDQPDFDTQLFSEEEIDIIELARAMTRDIAVPAPLKVRMVQRHGTQVVVEAIAVVASYNMVARFLVIWPSRNPYFANFTRSLGRLQYYL
jgi:hypothetical protein